MVILLLLQRGSSESGNKLTEMRKTRTVVKTICAFLAVVLPLFAGQSNTIQDRAVVSVLQQADPNLRHVKIVNRISITRKSDLVIVLGSSEAISFYDRKQSFWWGKQQKLGLLIQEQSRPEKVYLLTAQAGPEECDARLERATVSDTVISCTGEKTERYPNQKFVYDARAKKLLHHYQYFPFIITRAIRERERVVFIADDEKRLVALEYAPGNNPALRILDGAEGRRRADQENIRSAKTKQFKNVYFGSSHDFVLRKTGDRFEIFEKGSQQSRSFPLPQSSYDEVAIARPEEVRNGLTRQAATINEAIGPWELYEGRLWFGKTFYDGEGSTGIGGFGYFDPQNRHYRLFAPKQVMNWSMTAMHVDANAVWLGIAHRGEWGDTSGGFLRFDRRSETVTRWKLASLVSEILSQGDQLLIVTDMEIAALKENELQRFFVDVLSDGRLRVTAATMKNLACVRCP